jgi:hypothetical protein
MFLRCSCVLMQRARVSEREGLFQYLPMRTCAKRPQLDLHMVCTNNNAFIHSTSTSGEMGALESTESSQSSSSRDLSFTVSSDACCVASSVPTQNPSLSSATAPLRDDDNPWSWQLSTWSLAVIACTSDSNRDARGVLQFPPSAPRSSRDGDAVTPPYITA